MAHGVAHAIVNEFAGVLRTGARSKPVERRRKVSPRCGKALEALGHAIEYLTDEHYNQSESLRLNDPLNQAVKILMAANRAVYFDCPEVPTLRERCTAWLEHRVA